MGKASTGGNPWSRCASSGCNQAVLVFPGW